MCCVICQVKGKGTGCLHTGATKTILSDNGREFNIDVFRELSGQFNITIKATAVELPWSNGIVARHDAVLEKTTNKFIKDEIIKYPHHVILAWAVSAKNALYSQPTSFW